MLHYNLEGDRVRARSSSVGEYTLFFTFHHLSSTATAIGGITTLGDEYQIVTWVKNGEIIA